MSETPFEPHGPGEPGLGPNAGDWIIRVGEQEYRAPDLQTVRHWIAEGRIPRTAYVWDPNLAPHLLQWQLASSFIPGNSGHATPVAMGRKKLSKRARNVLLVVFGLPLLGFAACTSCFVGLALIGLQQEHSAKTNLPRLFAEGESKMAAQDWSGAFKAFDEAVDHAEHISDNDLKARAYMDRATAEAMLGQRDKAVEDFEIGFEANPDYQTETYGQTQIALAATSGLTAMHIKKSERAARDRQYEKEKQEKAWEDFLKTGDKLGIPR